MKTILVITALVLTWLPASSAGQDVEIYVMDSFVSPEKPHKLNISFFTTDSCKSKIIIAGKYEFPVSTRYVEDHTFSREISDMKFDSVFVPFTIVAEDRSGNEYSNSDNGFDLPEINNIQKGNHGELFMVCLGGIIYLLPSAGIAAEDGNYYFTLAKELPLVSFFSIGKDYPAGIISAEYAHIFEGKTRNYLRIGYKYFLTDLPAFEYISFGLNGFTDFLGFNGISPEVSIGLIKIFDAFTVYGRYRYNFSPVQSRKFGVISFGLYAYFFSLTL